MNKSLEQIFPNPPSGVDPSLLHAQSIPAHVAIIMDGNGRWAKKRGNNRLTGHKAGISAVRESIRTASDLGVRYLTIYSFSTENWKRSDEEVSGLMNLFAKTMLAEVDELHEEHVRVMTIGDMSPLPQKTRDAFEKAWEKTKNNTGMTLVVAVNYGGRKELTDAVQKIVDEACAAAAKGNVAPVVNDDMIDRHLYTRDIPDPDLLIRTSGELRISNFLLWQIAYTEMYCTDVLWPDFDRYDFLEALLDYQSRSRRFGAEE